MLTPDIGDDFPIQISVTACPITPGYVFGHAISLQPAPSLLILPEIMDTKEGLGKIISRYRPKRKSVCNAIVQAHFSGINDGIGEAADPRYNRYRTVSQRAELG